MDRSDLEAAFTLPFAPETSLDTVAVGVLVTLASFTTPLAGVLLVGYVVRLVRGGLNGTTRLPAFDDVTDMAVEGARLSALLVVLQLPAIALAALVAGSSTAPFTVAAAVSDPRMVQYLDVSVFDVLGLVVAGVAALAGTYLAAAGAVALAAERSLVASLPLLRALAFDASFASVVSASALVVFGGRILGFFVGTSPVAGVAFTACVSFLTLVAAATLLGRGIGQSSGCPQTDRYPSVVGAESA